jgi:hypothetical protein
MHWQAHLSMSRAALVVVILFIVFCLVVICASAITSCGFNESTPGPQATPNEAPPWPVVDYGWEERAAAMGPKHLTATPVNRIGSAR